MSKTLHDIRTILKRLEIQAELLAKQDFGTFSKEEIVKDAAADIEKLNLLLKMLSSDQ